MLHRPAAALTPPAQPSPSPFRAEPAGKRPARAARSPDRQRGSGLADLDHTSLAGLRFVEIPDDHLEPETRRRDYILLASTDRYIGEGYYLVRGPCGDDALASYHCTAGGTRASPEVRLTCLNPAYRGLADLSLAPAAFAAIVVGKAAMTCKVQDHGLIHHRIAV